MIVELIWMEGNLLVDVATMMDDNESKCDVRMGLTHLSQSRIRFRITEVDFIGYNKPYPRKISRMVKINIYDFKGLVNLNRLKVFYLRESPLG